MKKDRFATAYAKNISSLQQIVSAKGIDTSSYEIHLRAYKQEAILEIWIKGKQKDKWERLRTYPFCTNSGTSGPKRREGDLQIPEGFYHIDRFNPKSKFHLSLGLNYPAASDKIRSDASRPGSDIFIHGGCQSVGCIAITDKHIEWLYVLATEAKNQGQKRIGVRIFPCSMDKNTLNKLTQQFPQHQSFWEELKSEDLYFKKHNSLLGFRVGLNGELILEDGGR